jgi:hypothetical protein
MQLIINIACILGLFLLFATQSPTSAKDISNLYSSRDRIWKEFFKLQQTNKRRDKELRRRIHNLERKINGISRGKSEAL